MVFSAFRDTRCCRSLGFPRVSGEFRCILSFDLILQSMTCSKLRTRLFLGGGRKRNCRACESINLKKFRKQRRLPLLQRYGRSILFSLIFNFTTISLKFTALKPSHLLQFRPIYSHHRRRRWQQTRERKRELIRESAVGERKVSHSHRQTLSYLKLLSFLLINEWCLSESWVG